MHTDKKSIQVQVEEVDESPSTWNLLLSVSLFLYSTFVGIAGLETYAKSGTCAPPTTRAEYLVYPVYLTCQLAAWLDQPPSSSYLLTTPPTTTPQYTPGQCLVLRDPETGTSNPDDILRVEAVGATHYTYRWYLLQHTWAQTTSQLVGEFAVLERITTRRDVCPE